ncbi:copper amine oxidase-like protein [Moorella sp. E308F]|uniref:copper amine oxidase N-terminal domain-containing protein n=1 Tax=Moorella sp. E308F TaxID=2572682 RepID=UPI0010FFC0A5|nr:copper amine oxidase N-terminal domain-containing protein [Moorella sp. E308F]GEA16316.1 copper amine oxidase-like protein [Moorella sp. E308F]
MLPRSKFKIKEADTVTRNLNIVAAFLLAAAVFLAAGGIAEAKNSNVTFVIDYNLFAYLTPNKEVNHGIVNREMDVAPFVENGRIYIPVRYLAEGMGASEKDVVWDEATKTVTISLEGTTVKLQMGSNILYVNGEPQEMDVTPVIRDGRVFLPARFVAEAFGYEVTYRGGADKGVYFHYKKE